MQMCAAVGGTSCPEKYWLIINLIVLQCEQSEKSETKRLQRDLSTKKTELILFSFGWNDTSVKIKQFRKADVEWEYETFLRQYYNKSSERGAYLAEKKSIDILVPSCRSFIFTWVRIKWVRVASALLYQDVMRFQKKNKLALVRECSVANYKYPVRLVKYVILLRKYWQIKYVTHNQQTIYH